MGDNFLRLQQAILDAAERSQILITTGGLGPTPDDITTETIASAFNTPLEHQKSIFLDIQNKRLFNDC